MMQQAFVRTIGIDYSGRDTPVARLNALAVYSAEGNAEPQRVVAPGDALWRWSRRVIAEWLVQQLADVNRPALVGIDHAFSFPLRYFEQYPNHLGGDWDDFLDDFVQYWPTDEDNALVSVVREGTGQLRMGETNWYRLTDRVARVGSSVFRFVGQGQVGHSTHAGIPWLRYIRRELEDAGVDVHFWPFDGWDVPPGRSVIVEVYPSLWSRHFDVVGRSGDQHDAYSVAGWLSYAGHDGWLDYYFHPQLSPQELGRARTEGWIFGVPGFIRFPL